MNILIVDDHAIVRAGLRRLLRGLFEAEKRSRSRVHGSSISFCST
jgi:DNA-binding NarL/FixJ family response regulator